MSLGLFVGEFGKCLQLMEGEWKSNTESCDKILYCIQNTMNQMENIIDHDLFFDQDTLPINKRLLFCQCKEMERMKQMLLEKLSIYEQIIRSCTDSFKLLQAKTKTGIIEEKSLTGLTKGSILKNIHHLILSINQDYALKCQISASLFPFSKEKHIAFIEESRVDFYKISQWKRQVKMHHQLEEALRLASNQEFTRITIDVDSVAIKTEQCPGFCRFLSHTLAIAFKQFRQLQLREETLEASKRTSFPVNFHLSFILPAGIQGNWLNEAFMLYLCNGKEFNEMKKPLKCLFRECGCNQSELDSVNFYLNEIENSFQRIAMKFACKSSPQPLPMMTLGFSQRENEHEFQDVLHQHQQAKNHFQEVPFVCEQSQFVPIL